jgi:CYTH domain-containing protein
MSQTRPQGGSSAGAQEIERKFRIERPPDWLEEHPATELHQGYIVVTDDAEVRLRKADGEHKLTVKRGKGEVRREEEIGLEAEQFEALWPLTESQRVSKRRYRVPLEATDLTAEVDVFEGDLEGLVVAEVEFGSEDQGAAFEPPAWFGRELTGDERYATASLARTGLPGDE